MLYREVIKDNLLSLMMAKNRGFLSHNEYEDCAAFDFIDIVNGII